MNGIELVAHGFELAARGGGVAVAIVQRIRHEQHAGAGRKQAPDLGFRVVQVAASVLGGVADEEQTVCHAADSTTRGEDGSAAGGPHFPVLEMWGSTPWTANLHSDNLPRVPL